MEPSGMFLGINILTVFFFVVFCMIIVTYTDYGDIPESVGWGMIFFVIVLWFAQEGCLQEEVSTRNKVVEKVLVSTAPSHTQVSGGFVLLWGAIGTNRVYLLREEVSEGLYKDFEVRHEVYIREDNTLTNKGKFTKFSECTTYRESYELLVWTLTESTREHCTFTRQEIAVPVGSVIKNLSI